MRVAAENQIGAGVDARPSDVNLGGIGLIVELLAPVERTDDVIRAVGLHLLNGRPGFVLVRNIVIVSAVDADAKPMLRRDDFVVVFLAVIQSVFFQRRIGREQAGLTEVE